MKRLLSFILFVCSLSLAQVRIPGPGGSAPAGGCSSASGHTYSTLFPLTESPISECSSWLNGAADGGNNWTNFNSTTNFAFGTESNSSAHFDDSTALIQGTWGNDQQIVGVVVGGASVGAGKDKEHELRLRSTLNSTTNSGYEFQFVGSESTTANCTVNIVRWNGALDDFTSLATGSGGANFCLTTGSVIRAVITGTTLTAWVNDIQAVTTTSATYSSGRPGIGSYIHGTGVTNDFGFSAIRASDNPIMYVQSASNNVATSQNPPKVSVTLTTTTGDTLWCATYWGSTSKTGSVSDTVNGSYTAIDSPVNGSTALSSYRAQSFYITNITGGSTTITLQLSGTTASTDRAISCHEVRGVNTLDQHPAVKNGSTASTTATSNTTSTTTSDDEYVAGWCVLGGGYNQTNNVPPWYERQHANFGSNSSGDQYSSKAGTYQFSVGQTSSQYLCGINTFKYQ